jgi:hypothetical protein
MQFYTLFAYFFMFALLFLLLRSVLQVKFWLQAFDAELERMKSKLDEKTWYQLQHHPVVKASQASSKEVLVEAVMTPVVRKIKQVEMFSAIASPAGMFFTLTSFIVAAQNFGAAGNVQTMFSAVSVGMGTTAVAAVILILSRLLLAYAEGAFNQVLDSACQVSTKWRARVDDYMRSKNANLQVK